MTKEIWPKISSIKDKFNFTVGSSKKTFPANRFFFTKYVSTRKYNTTLFKKKEKKKKRRPGDDLTIKSLSQIELYNFFFHTISVNNFYTIFLINSHFLYLLEKRHNSYDNF